MKFSRIFSETNASSQKGPRSCHEKTMTTNLDIQDKADRS